MLDTLNALLEEQIKDLYNAENQLVKALPKMAKAASSPELKEAFTSHLEETKGHVDRLKQVAEILEIKPTGKTCKAMQGLVAEGAEVLEEDGEEPVIDAALIAAAQRVEHYEISAYGTARAIAEQLGLKDVVKILQTTLDEESAADEKLSTISEDGVLVAALALGNGEEEEEDGE
jgi:ferritin-like metal-binding protein YciE